MCLFNVLLTCTHLNIPILSNVGKIEELEENKEEEIQKELK